MDDVKKGYREAEETTKETLRKADGEESTFFKLVSRETEKERERGR